MSKVEDLNADYFETLQTEPRIEIKIKTETRITLLLVEQKDLTVKPSEDLEFKTRILKCNQSITQMEFWTMIDS